MCKLFALSATARLSRQQLNDTVDFIARCYGKTQGDGLGIALQCGSRRHIERYVEPRAFGGLGAATPPDPRLNAPATFEVTEGGPRGYGGPLVIHGRTSTGHVNLTNTHPFTAEGWSLAHNGVVGWHGEKHPLETTCDSEHLLNVYAYGRGIADLGNVSGWAAWLAITPQGRLVAGRDTRTPLALAYIKQWRCYALATRTEDLRAYLKAMGQRSVIVDVADNAEVRFGRDGAMASLQLHGGLRQPEAKMYASANVALGYTQTTYTGSWKHTVSDEARPQFDGERTTVAFNPAGGTDTQWERVADWERENFHGEGAP